MHFLQGSFVSGECQEHYETAISCLGFSVPQESVNSHAKKLMYFDLWFSFLGRLPPVLSTVEMFSIVDKHL